MKSLIVILLILTTAQANAEILNNNPQSVPPREILSPPSIPPIVSFSIDTHTILSQKPFVLVDGITRMAYQQLRGGLSISWKDGARSAVFVAKVIPAELKAPILYEFSLVSVGSSGPDFIQGIFDIRKNGQLVAQGIVGQLSGLKSPVGSYFKFYGGTSTAQTYAWHISGYITHRLDF